MSYGFFTLMDRSREKAVISFNLETIDPTGSNYGTLTTAQAALLAGIQGVTEGVVIEQALVADRERLTNVKPSLGQREDKWLVRYEDDTTKKIYVAEIPCAKDSAVVMENATDFWDMGGLNPAQTAFTAAWNLYVKSPVGNDVTVLSVQRVGRNS